MVDNTIRLSASDLACDDGYDSSWSVVKSHPPVPATDRDVSDALDFCDDEDLEDDCAPSSLAVPPVNFGEIVIQDSTDVHIGNKTFYNGSVTIKQFVISKDEESKLGRLPPTPTSNGTLARSCSHLCEPTKDENQKEQNKLRYLKSPYTIGGIIIMLLVCTLLTVYLVTGFTANVEDDVILPKNSSLRLFRRSDWFATPNTGYDEIPKLEVVPPKYVVVSHTVTAACRDPASCSRIVRDIQLDHTERDYGDIGYSFLVGGDGTLFEGRGWTKWGAHTYGLNGFSIGLAFIGNFELVRPTEDQLEAARVFLEQGASMGRLHPDFRVILHCQIHQTKSPGANLAPIIKRWPRWGICDGECKAIASKHVQLPRQYCYH